MPSNSVTAHAVHSNSVTAHAVHYDLDLHFHERISLTADDGHRLENLKNVEYLRHHSTYFHQVFTKMIAL